MMHAVTVRDYVPTRVEAHQLCDDDLIATFYRMRAVMLESSSDEVAQKFNLEVAWFRELSYEMQRRNLLEVN